MTLGKLSRFEKLFKDTIIQRGYDYENMGRVTQLTIQSLTGDSNHFSSKTKQYSAKVIGSRPYQVKSLLTDLPDNDRVIESLYCSCPYGDHCKHMVAMLLKIRNLQLEGQLSSLSDETKMESIQDVEVAEIIGMTDSHPILKSLNESALRAFIAHAFLRHPGLQDDLIIWHAQYKAKQQITNKATINTNPKQDDNLAHTADKLIQDSRTVSYERDPTVLKSLYRQIGSLLDLDESLLYGYEPDVSENLYQFDLMFSQLDAQPHYQLSAIVCWIDIILRLYDDHPESDLQELMDKGFAKLGKLFFAVDEDEYGFGYLPQWSEDFKCYHTDLPDCLITELRQKIGYWQSDDDIQQISQDCNIGRLYFDLYIAKQDWLGAINVLNQNIEQATVEKYSEYSLENLAVLKMSLLNHIHTTPKLAVYAKTTELVAQVGTNYSYLPKVRHILVNNAIQQGKVDDAINLIERGIVIAQQKGHKGTVRDWREQLIEIAYQALKDDKLPTIKHNKDDLMTIVRNNSEVLAFDHYRVDHFYYKQWKNSYAATEWQQIIMAKQEELKHDLLQNMQDFYPNRTSLSILAEIYALEKETQALVALLKAYPDINDIKRYQQELIATDADWLISYYQKYWKQRIERVSNRAHYHELTQDIQSMLDVLPKGKSVWQPMVSAWQARFSTKPRRPALLDELSKIRWGN